MLNWLVAASKLHKHRGHVALLSGSSIHFLFYGTGVDLVVALIFPNVGIKQKLYYIRYHISLTKSLELPPAYGFFQIS